MRAAICLIILVLFGVVGAFGQSLSGSWDTDISFDPQQTGFADALSMTSTLISTYTVGDWAFTTTTKLDEAGWVDQDFGVVGLLGAFTVTSAIDLDVQLTKFGSWVTTVGLDVAGIDFRGAFTLKENSVDLDLAMTGGSGTAVQGEIILGLGGGVDCDFDFQDVKIGVDFTFGCSPVESDIYFTCANGFEYANFKAGGIAIPNLPWVTLGALLHFELDSKEITITPSFNFGPILCFDLLFDVDEKTGATFPNDTLEFNTISVVGIGIGCTIGGVDFYGLSRFDGSIRGKYWEQYSIDASGDVCCGDVFEFGLDVFFEEHAQALFDVALIETNAKINVTQQFAFTMELDIETDGGFTEWCVGFEVTW
jgi:hypothetical protein